MQLSDVRVKSTNDKDSGLTFLPQLIVAYGAMADDYIARLENE